MLTALSLRRRLLALASVALIVAGSAPSAFAQAPTLVQFSLSERSTYVETTHSDWQSDRDLRYFSKSKKYELCTDCEDGTEPGCADCWWARCDQLLAEPLTLKAMKTYATGLGQPEQMRHVADRASLRALVYNEPEGTLQGLLPQTRAAWNEIGATDRDRLIALGRDCTVGGPDPLVFTFVLSNPGERAVFVTEIVHHRLFDFGEAAGGPPGTSGPFEPEVDYVHEVDFKCEFEAGGGQSTESVARPLAPPFRIMGDDAVSFELQSIYDGTSTGFLAPIKMRLDVVTSGGTVSTPEFIVEAPSCGG
ncbi:MAG: hypothetical protein ABJF88_01365 [Rhodothermales bacterium]